ncbi:MAG: hypothetical protein M3511_09935, partial [Deinococcota bacterium]|nr:hypothetical protein [Deinococcota bacterium]
ETWLAKARHGGLPMTSLGGGGYQPHGIVLSVLEQLLRQKPERHAALHLAAASHAETNGRLLFAIDHLRIGGHHDEAFRMLEELLPRWKWRSDWSLVRKMLEPFDALPPRLNTALGLALIETRDPERGETILREQIRSDNASGWTHFGLSLLAYRRGDAEGTLEHAQDGLALVRDQRMVILLLQSKVVGLVALNKKEEALEAARECLKRAEAVGDPSLLVRGLSLMGYVLRTKGEAEASLAFGRRALDLAFSAGIPNRALAAVTDLFGYHYRKGQALEALPLVEKMLDIGKTEYPLAVPWMLRDLGYFHQQQASFEVAHAQFLEAAELFEKDGNRIEAGNCLTDVIYCLLRLGRLEHAEARLPAARGFLLAANDHNQHAPYYVAEGMVRFYEGRLEAAAEAFERQKKERGEGYPVRFDNIAAVGRLAEIARRKGTLSHQRVSALISELDRMGHDWPLGVEAQPLKGLYQECVRRGWFAERFRPYLTASRVSQEPPRALLELKTFGGFRATLDGHDIPAAPKGREVLAYLALYGPSRADTVADAIWGHLDLAAARNNLKVQIRHLRAAAPATGLVRWD